MPLLILKVTLTQEIHISTLSSLRPTLDCGNTQGNLLWPVGRASRNSVASKQSMNIHSRTRFWSERGSLAHFLPFAP